MKEVVGCVQDVTGKRKFLVKFEYVQNVDIGSILFLYVCSEEEVCFEIDKPLLGLTQKEQCKLLTINGDNVVEEGSMFERGMHLYF